MPTAISHSIIAPALGILAPSSALPRRFLLLGAVFAMLPDLDAIGFRFGVPYADMLGHRGISHSIFPALLLSLAVAAVFSCSRNSRVTFPVLFLYLFACAVSHGLLDAMTDGGLGVAFFAPFDQTRYFFPWRPIEATPLNYRRFLSDRGIQVLTNEAIWIGLPSVLLCLSVWSFRGLRNRRRLNTM